jgi:hypothetical protein
MESIEITMGSLVDKDLLICPCSPKIKPKKQSFLFEETENFSLGEGDGSSFISSDDQEARK